jgi:TDG/mug DNA glycosylase family protein
VWHWNYLKAAVRTAIRFQHLPLDEKGCARVGKTSRPASGPSAIGLRRHRCRTAVGHYYAHPGNRFWRTIFEVGITPRRYQPHEFPALLKLGIGFTDVCKLGAGMDYQALAFPVDIPAFREKMQRYRPMTVAFTSKKAASLFYGRPTKAIMLGRQPPLEDFPIVFVLASPSGAASGHWSVQPWQELADSISP